MTADPADPADPAGPADPPGPAGLVLATVTEEARAAVLAGDPTGGGAFIPSPGWPDDGTRVAWSFGMADLVVLLDGVAIGACGVKRVSDGRAELGWGLVPEVRGRGLGTATVRLLAAAALARPGVDSVWAEVDADNLPSLGAARSAGVPTVLSPAVQPARGD